MLLNTLTTNTLALFALLSPLAAAQDLDTDGLLSRNAQPLDVTLKFYPSNTCAGSGGPERSYSNGACLPLNTDTRGVRILDRRASCHIVAYTSGTCSGNGRKLDANGCWTLRDRKSLRFRC